MPVILEQVLVWALRFQNFVFLVKYRWTASINKFSYLKPEENANRFEYMYTYIQSSNTTRHSN